MSAAIDLRTVLPEVVVAALAMAVLMWDVLAGVRGRKALAPGTILGLAAAAGAVIWVGPRPPAFAGAYLRDAATVLFQAIALISAVLATLLGADYLRRTGLERGEYYALLLFACLGAMVMAAAGDLIVLFLGLETLSIPLYVLAAFRRGNVRSQEAGMKYFLLGSFSTAFFLYGVALLYGASGSTALGALARAAAAGLTPLLGIGVALFSIGLAFKAALVPFHTWAPDVYEGAPLPVTAYMAVVAKVGAFAAVLRAFPLALPGLAGQWTLLLATLSVATMILGNLVALVQRSMKRLLAYSSIAHAGYLLIGVAAGGAEGAWAMVFYLVAYLFMTLGAFAVVLLLQRAGEEADLIEEYAGLGGRAPWLAAAMAVFMVSLAGLPPTAGFIGKFYLFSAALAAGQPAVALVGALTSVVSVYYYLRVPYIMFVGREVEGVEVVPAPGVRAVVVTAAAAVILLGVLPGALTQAVHPLVDLFGAR
ncbi:MAG: NADH-quinone oxidoreductase subunit N [Armatimonadota bacterium]|nr:NADH-quinone oxidoreductase subunit N [Armatimonadota bacterium]MDR7468993.1 NADH-quinone oxidoreductase subunit N [Armatimonadota bacterium]MDR7474040.1 NADH-quinone oxidoreductase subunit N [Armatimonadota bacterium]MDR7538034.1 NADH-quinone oxidoreductase subunit N [Armatimonadota bacterium]